MTETTSEISIRAVSATPTSVKPGDTINVVVSVTSDLDTFQDETAFRLFLLVCACGGTPPKGTPITLKGHLGDANWPTQDADINLSVIAGAAPDVYNITVVLLEGGDLDLDSVPSLGTAGPIVVHP